MPTFTFSLQPQKHTMKKTVSLLLLITFGFTFAQKSEQLLNEAQIDQQIADAKKISSKNIKKTIEISKKTYQDSKVIDYKKGMLESNILLMAKYFDIGNFKKVIELNKETINLAEDTGDNEKLANTHRLSAASLTELGFNDESQKEFRIALQITKMIRSENCKYYQQALIYNGLASYSAHINAPIDSVIYYQKKSLETVLKIDEDIKYTDKKYHTLALAYMNLGMTNVAKHRPKEAEMYFSKALKLCTDTQYKINKDLEVAVLNEFAWLYYDQKKYTEAILYAKQAEQMEKQLSLPYIRRDIYEVMFKSSVENGEKDTSSKYMNLYTALNDSLVNVEKKTINTPVKQLMNTQGEKYTKHIQKLIILSSAALIITLLAGWLFWKKKQQQLTERYRIIIDELQKRENSRSAEEPIVSTDRSAGIKDDTTKTIIAKLKKFETSQKFLREDISLSYLANSINTNTRYLSEVIKQHKGKSFNNYINGLRIQYITEALYKDPKYREYKISYLAQVCGFSSREVFGVIFKKETGVTPSFFISQLKNDQK